MGNMSNTRKSDAETALKIAKVFKVLGFISIGIGVLFCLTIIGIVFGIILIMVGCAFIFIMSNIFKKRGDAMLQDLAEESRDNAVS